ncbi:MAG TPA: hypothetical protein VI457_01465 [Methylococcaceae bacterium]|nr:hypothetical protein [Methylococcaceae bacterium]
MFAELIESWITPCPAEGRRLGYLRESIALGARHRRCREAWQDHLAQTRVALLASLSCCRSHRIALVFGSGALLDVPLEELAGRFEDVWLVDAVHPLAARRQMRRYSNVQPIVHDVTECVFGLPDLDLPTAADLQRLVGRSPHRFLEENRIDWVASVNLFSQLHLLPVAWLQRHQPQLDDAALNAFAVALLRRHLDYLAAFRAPVCLVADLEQTTRNVATGEMIERTDLSNFFVGWPEPFAAWDWELAPPGELARDVASRHRVGAFYVNEPWISHRSLS